MDKETEIRDYYIRYCSEHLDKEYQRLFDLVTDILLQNPELLSRGKAEIWAASIVWSVGSVNFLSDKSQLPHATLTDICDWFKTNSSTVINKASLIRDYAGISSFNNKFLRKDGDVSKFINGFTTDELGFIHFKKVDEEDNNDSEIQDEPEIPSLYQLKLSSSVKITNAILYQLEFLAKKHILSPDRFEKIAVSGHGTVDINYFGIKSGLNDFTKALKKSPFIVSELSICNEQEI